MISRFSFPTEVLSGKDALKELPEFANRFGNKAIIVTSRMLFQDSDILEKLVAQLQSKNFNVLLYDSIGPHSDSLDVDTMASLAKSSRCDFVIGLGGDTVLHMAKAVAVLCTNPGEAADYLTEQDGYRLQISHAPLPTIMIPTTFGTLCEVTPGFVLRDHNDGLRKKLYNQAVRPSATILDPILTRLIPRKYLSASGILVLSLAIELYLSTESNLYSDAMAQRVMEMVTTNLVNLNRDQDNMELRGQLMQASLLMSYGASATSLGPIYCLMETMTSSQDIYRGSIAAVMLPQIMEYNLTSAPGRYVQIVKFMGEDVSKISVLEAAIKAVERIRMYIEEFTIPTRLAELGFDSIYNESISSHFFRFEESKNNSRPITQDDLRVILEQSM